MSENVTSLTEARITYLEGLVSQARTAAAVFTQYTQEDVDRIVKPMVSAGMEQAQHLARLAFEETKLGVLEDKAIKNMVAAEFVYNYVKDKRTVGVIHEFPERGIEEVAEPMGVIFSLTPITNPTATVLFKCIMAIKTRNALLFSPHPKAWRCSHEAMQIMYEAAVKHGAPEGVFTCVESPTLADNAYLMQHRDVSLQRRWVRPRVGSECGERLLGRQLWIAHQLDPGTLLGAELTQPQLRPVVKPEQRPRRPVA